MISGTDTPLETGLRCTIAREAASDVAAMFDLAEAESIPRVCFYHLSAAHSDAEIEAFVRATEMTFAERGKANTH